MNERIENCALNNMILKAEELKLTYGVALILILKKGGEYPRVVFAKHNSIEREVDSNRGVSDRGINYYGIAMSKLAEMLSTGKNSGLPRKNIKFGELNFEGGLTTYLSFSEDLDFRIFTAFSGGTEKQDVEIAKVGLDYITENFSP